MPWLRPMHSVILVLQRTALKRRQQRIEIGQQDVGCLLQLHRKAGIQHIR